MESGVCERSETGKPARGIENQFTRKKLDHHEMQISDDQHFEKVFKNLRQKLFFGRWRSRSMS